jgi:hypothetical protein
LLDADPRRIKRVKIRPLSAAASSQPKRRRRPPLTPSRAISNSGRTRVRYKRRLGVT